VILSGIAGLTALGLLVRGLANGFDGRINQLLRPAAVVAVVTVIWGFFVAQHPYILPTSLTIEEAAGDPASLTAVIVVFAIAAVVILPSIALLYWLSQRRALE
jgi:cytochrome d ubiquinol oxidase subunit II